MNKKRPSGGDVEPCNPPCELRATSYATAGTETTHLVYLNICSMLHNIETFAMPTTTAKLQLGYTRRERERESEIVRERVGVAAVYAIATRYFYKQFRQLTSDGVKQASSPPPLCKKEAEEWSRTWQLSGLDVNVDADCGAVSVSVEV